MPPGWAVNSMQLTSNGTIICAIGDQFPNNFGSELDNYAAFLEIDTTDGKILLGNEWNDTSGFNIGGFHVEEVNTGKYLLSGNQAVQCIDTNGTVIWTKKYTMMLDSVGSVDNDVYKAKMLRNGSLMVVGVTYEGDCWQRYKTLYRDAWWSLISYSSGGNESWGTAGVHGGNDRLYDFAQLLDGKIAFMGTEATPADSGIWIIVTDSTGNEILWQKQYNLPEVDENDKERDNILPLSICATPDSGFTVVGDDYPYNFNNNQNAFAIHFVPLPPVILNLQIKHQLNYLNRHTV